MPRNWNKKLISKTSAPPACWKYEFLMDHLLPCSHAMPCIGNVHSSPGRIASCLCLMLVTSSLLPMNGHNPFSFPSEKGQLLTALWSSWHLFRNLPLSSPPCLCIQGTLCAGYQQTPILRKGYSIFVINDVGIPAYATKQGDRCHCLWKSLPPPFLCSSMWRRWTWG